MKATITVKKQVEVDLKSVRVTLPINYGEEDIPHDFPLRENDIWRATIDIDTGRIQEWPQGKAGTIEFMKVADGGTYTLIDVQGNTVAEIKENYVPQSMIPPLNGYGDYVSFEIDENGIIKNWYKNPSIKEFFNED